MLLDYNDSIYSNNIISYNINLPVTNVMVLRTVGEFIKLFH